MKHIKTYKLFEYKEDSKDLENLELDLLDSLVDLTDDYYKIATIIYEKRLYLRIYGRYIQTSKLNNYITKESLNKELIRILTLINDYKKDYFINYELFHGSMYQHKIFNLDEINDQKLSYIEFVIFENDDPIKRNKS